MKNLICHTANCEHNIKCRCTAGLVSVGERGKCLTKAKRDGGALAQAFADVEAGADFDMVAGTECAVQCNALCVHNNHNVCTCERITVDDTLAGTKCKSRISRK